MDKLINRRLIQKWPRLSENEIIYGENLRKIKENRGLIIKKIGIFIIIVSVTIES